MQTVLPKSQSRRHFFVLLILFFGIILTPGAADDTQGNVVDYPTAVRELSMQINAIREREGRRALEQDPLLTACAASYARELAYSGRFSHVDEDGGRAVHRLREMGGSSLRVGEVLGKAGLEHVSLLPHYWMRSETHRSVLLNHEWTHAGIGVAWTEGESIVVALFTVKPFEEIHFTVKSGENKNPLGTGGPQGLLIEGMFRTRVGRPILCDETRCYHPHQWDPESGKFAFFLDFTREIYYIKGGYQTEKGIMYTDTFLVEK